MIIGIPHFNDEKNLKNCIDSLINSTKVSIQKIIIVNADEKVNLDYYKSYKNIEIIHIKNKGPLHAYNKLFKIAQERKEDLFLTQTDVLFKTRKKDWLQEMIEGAKREDCGMITCWGGGGVSGPDFINGFQWVGAWCTYIPYRTIEKLSGYDENIPLGWGVDIDYSYAVQQLGLKIYMINYWVEHFPDYEKNHQHEQVENIKELKKEAYRYMREKWKVGEYSVMDR